MEPIARHGLPGFEAYTRCGVYVRRTGVIPGTTAGKESLR
jgi:hypothetical protein